MSFSCPHYDFGGESCWRLGKPCVPGRPGCVLRHNSVFATPVEERLEAEREREPRSHGPKAPLPDREG